ncbi:tripartite tricarboxylate transporter substrate binding protein [Orrella sp. JC864]|uniref:Bug family tripartite tricarboxylate transporter substrate binding protein n=1 Tax=Orrella sp. JC864 TaxID=3120298 RepID=UPI0012BC2F5E
MRKTLAKAGIALGLCLAAAAAAADYPDKPIRMYIGFSPGSATDIVGRVIADALAKRLGQPVIVENKVGAGGSIAAQDTARAAPDGYTLLTVSSAIAVNPAVYKGAGDVLRGLAPIAMIGYQPTVLLAGNKLPVDTLQAFVGHARQHPGELNFGSSGVGGSTHLAMEEFANVTGTSLTHIPYKGNAQASAALLGGEISALMDTVMLAAPLVQSGRAKGLAVTGERRSALMPDVPTFAEAGVPEYDRSLFFGVMAPAGLPEALVQKLNREVNAALQDAAVRERLMKTGGLSLHDGTAADFQRILDEEVALWRRVAESANISAK